MFRRCRGCKGGRRGGQPATDTRVDDDPFGQADEAVYRGGRTDLASDIEAAATDAQAMDFQVEAVAKMFVRMHIPPEHWCAALEIANPSALSAGQVRELLSGTHPSIQYLQVHGVPHAPPPSVQASNA